MEEVYISGVKWYKIGGNVEFLKSIEYHQENSEPIIKRPPSDKKWNVVKKKT